MLFECAECRTLRERDTEPCPLCTRTLCYALVGKSDVIEPESGETWQTLFERLWVAYKDLIRGVKKSDRRLDGV